MAVKFKDTININGEYTFPNTDGSVGQAIITDGGGNLTFGSAVASSADNSESVHIPVKNTSGVSISKGTPVYITGETGNSGKIEIAAADAVNANKMPVLGLLESTLSDNGEGFCVQGGLLENVATATIDGQTPTANQTVYVKSGGGLTLTKPTGTALIQNIAKVARVHASQGSLVVSAILRTNDIPNLPEGKIWVGDDNTTVSTIVHLDELNGRVGIGTDSPNAELEIHGNLNIGDGTSVTSIGLQRNSANYITATDAAGYLVFRTGGTTERMRITSGGDISFRDTSNNEAFYWDASTASLGIGTGSSPSEKLEVKDGSIRTTTLNSFSNLISGRASVPNASGYNIGGLLFQAYRTGTTYTTGAAIYSYSDVGAWTSTSVPSYLSFQTAAVGTTNTTERMRIDSSGVVSIKNSQSAGSILNLENTNTSVSGGNFLGKIQFVSNDTSSQAAGVKASITAPVIGSFGETELAFSTAAYLEPSATERMRIDRNGNVGINTITPSVSLDISGTDAIQVPKGLTSDRPTPASGMFRFNTTTNEFEGYNGTEWAPIGGANAASIDVDSFTGDAVETAFTLSSAISEEVATQIYIDGVYQSKDNYSTSGTTLTFTDAPADGASIEVVHFTGISESDLNGSGTTNYISKWLDTDTLTNSIIYDNGTNVGIGTVNPATELEVKGGVGANTKIRVSTAGNSGEQPGIQFYRNASAYGEIKYDAGGNVGGESGLIYTDYRDDTSSKHIWKTRNVERMRISSEGDVTIGSSNDPKLYMTSTGGNGNNQRFYIDGFADGGGAGYGGGFRIHTRDTVNVWHERMRVQSNGNIGIGVTLPSAPLAVRADTGGIAIQTLGRSADGYSFLSFKNSAGSATLGEIGVSNAQNMQFYTAGGERMRISSTGNVGIGTTGPSYKLHIKETAANAKMYINGENGANTSSLLIGRDARNWEIKTDTAANGYKYSLSYIGTDAPVSNIFTALSNGNVGIGTTGPATKLHIQNPAAIDDAYGLLLVENTNGTASSSLANSGVNIKNREGTSQFMQWEEHGLRIGSRILTNNGVGNVIFTAGADSEKMRILANGNVGIGTTSPTQKIQVDGNARINGGLLVNGDYLTKKLDTPYFTNGVANLACNIQLGNNNFWGYIEVHITGTYSNQNTPGALIARYAVGTSLNNLIYANDREIIAADGPIKTNISLGNFQWDSGTSQYVIPISHIVSSGNGYSVLIKMFTHDSGAATVMPSLSISSLYTLTALPRLYKNINDRLGIGTTNPSAKLDVVGTIECTSLTETSALRFKENIQEDVDTSIIDKLRPVSYDWKETGDKDYGFIAEEVDELDSILTTKEEDGQLIGIKYTKLIPFLVKKIQEQEERIKQLENGKS